MEEMKRKKQVNLIEKRKKLQQELRENLFERFYYVDGENEFQEPDGTLEDSLSMLNRYNNLDKINNMTSIKIKVFIGKTLKYLKQIFNDDNSFQQTVNKEITYSKREVQFSINLSNLCEEYPKLQLSKLALRKLRANISLVESILKEDEQFWQL